VLIFEMLTGTAPFDGDDEDELFDNIKTADLDFASQEGLSPASISILKGFLKKDPKQRLGCQLNGVADIKDHTWFKNIDWVKLAKLEVPPPSKPKPCGKDASNFDPEFTTMKPNLTPTDARKIKQIDQGAFSGFSYVNPAFSKV